MDSKEEIKPLEGLKIENGTAYVLLHREEVADIQDGENCLEHIRPVLMKVEDSPLFKYWFKRMAPGREIQATHDGDIIEVRLIGRINT